MVLGRGREVPLSVQDKALSRHHAAFEIGPRGFRIVDLSSTNGIALNGTAVETTELGNGDRLTLGSHEYQYVVEEIVRTARVFDVSG